MSSGRLKCDTIYRHYFSKNRLFLSKWMQIIILTITVEDLGAQDVVAGAQRQREYGAAAR